MFPGTVVVLEGPLMDTGLGIVAVRVRPVLNVTNPAWDSKAKFCVSYPVLISAGAVLFHPLLANVGIVLVKPVAGLLSLILN